MKRGDNLSKYYIKIGSVTHAMKGRDILNSEGYRALVRRNSNPGKKDGCGYAIYLDGDLENAVSVLKSRNVNVTGHGSVSEGR